MGPGPPLWGFHSLPTTARFFQLLHLISIDQCHIQASKQPSHQQIKTGSDELVSWSTLPFNLFIFFLFLLVHIIQDLWRIWGIPHFYPYRNSTFLLKPCREQFLLIDLEMVREDGGRFWRKGTLFCEACAFCKLSECPTECTIRSIQVILGLQDFRAHHSNIFILGFKASLLPY